MSEPHDLGKSLRHSESLRVFSCTISGFVVKDLVLVLQGGTEKASGTVKTGWLRNAWLRLWAALRHTQLLESLLENNRNHSTKTLTQDAWAWDTVFFLGLVTCVTNTGVTERTV